jgi:hypothetical protein
MISLSYNSKKNLNKVIQQVVVNKKFSSIPGYKSTMPIKYVGSLHGTLGYQDYIVSRDRIKTNWKPNHEELSDFPNNTKRLEKITAYSIRQRRDTDINK